MADVDASSTEVAESSAIEEPTPAENEAGVPDSSGSDVEKPNSTDGAETTPAKNDLNETEGTGGEADAGKDSSGTYFVQLYSDNHSPFNPKVPNFSNGKILQLY